MQEEYGLKAIQWQAQRSFSHCPVFARRPDIDNSQGRLLIVEDDTALRRSLRTILDVMGFDVGEASNGEDGLVRLRMVDYEAVLLDINMPGMNGWEFVESFYEKFSANRLKCKVCLLSSSLDPRDKEKADKSEFVDFYFSKPLVPENVKAICKEISVNI